MKGGLPGTRLGLNDTLPLLSLNTEVLLDWRTKNGAWITANPKALIDITRMCMKEDRELGTMNLLVPKTKAAPSLFTLPQAPIDPMTLGFMVPLLRVPGDRSQDKA